VIDGQLSKKRVLTLGADPEMFVFSGVKLIPAYEFLSPKETGATQFWDGFQAEWKYDHRGTHCQNNLVMYTRENLMALDAKAKVYNPNARLTLANVVRVPQVTLNTARPEHVELGCQSSYNVYRMKGKPEYDPRKLQYRFAGGHMHFGTWTNARPCYEKIVKTLDSILGVWAVGVARDMDNPVRRQYYGLAGEFRKPKYEGGYGVEYRTLSNFWLASPAIMQLTWDIGRMCVRLGASRYGKLWAGNEQETIETINNCDVPQAEKILKRNALMLRWILKQVYKTEGARMDALLLAQQGLHREVENPEDFKTNWHFDDQWIPNAGQPWARFEV